MLIFAFCRNLKLQKGHGDRSHPPVQLRPADLQPGGRDESLDRDGTRVRRIISRFMRPDEEIRLWHNDDLWALLLHWSAKETIYKCMNMEGVDFCEHLRVVPFSPEPQGHFEACEYLTPDKQVYRIDYLLHPEFVLTWTSV